MKQDIRKRTCLIIEKERLYLSGWDYITGGLKWSRDCYDAWRTRDASSAQKVADKTGARILLFNPVIGQIKPYETGGQPCTRQSLTQVKES